MKHFSENIVRQRGNIRVAWVCIGEGYNGEYDPNDPEDELLLRLDVAAKNEETGDWKTVESRCTCFAASASPQDQEAALEILLDRFWNAYSTGTHQCLGALADEMSYISADTYYSVALEAEQETALLSGI